MNFRVAVVVSALLVAGPAALAAKAPNVDQLTGFFLAPELSAPQLSPTGEYVGVVARIGDDFRLGLLTLSTGQFEVEGGINDADVVSFWWKGPRRVILGVTANRKTALGQSYRAFGLIATDVDGRHGADLSTVVGSPGVLVDSLPDDPKHVLKATNSELLKVDIDSGRYETLEKESTGAFYQLRDGDNRFRAGYSFDNMDGSLTVKWREPGAGAGRWHDQTFKGGQPRIIPFGFDQDPRYLWVWDETQGNETVVSRMDTVTGERKVAVRRPGLDPTHALLAGRPRLPVAVGFEQDPSNSIEPLGAKHAEAIRLINACYQGFSPVIVDCQPERDLWIVHAGNSRVPGAYFLFNSKTNQSSLIGMVQSQLTEDRLVAPQWINIKGRTGAVLRGLLWQPPGVKRPPLLLRCPQRMPADPAADRYLPEVQALVSLGFAVAIVDVRGTYGYGHSNLAAADGYVVNTMREDLEDMVGALVADGYVDGRRVAVYGHGFGGALALKLASVSDAFTAAVSLQAPNRLSRHDLTQFSEDGSSRRTFENLGGWRQSGKLADELSPIEVAPALKKPALHLQNTEFDSPEKLNEEGRDLQRALDKSGAPGRMGIAFRVSHTYRPSSAVSRDEALQMQQIADFLNGVWTKP